MMRFELFKNKGTSPDKVTIKFWMRRIFTFTSDPQVLSTRCTSSGYRYW